MLRRAAIAVAVVAVSCGGAAARAQALSLTSFHAGPVVTDRSSDGATDPCLASPTAFPRTEEGDRPSDWCAAFTLEGEGTAAFDLELPEGTTLRLVAVAACSQRSACAPEAQVGTIATRSLGPFGVVEERGRLYATGPNSLVAKLDAGAARDDRAQLLALELTDGPLGGQVMRFPAFDGRRETEAGLVQLTPTLVVLRLWGTAAGDGAPLLTLGDCEAAHRARLTARPVDAAVAPMALVDDYLLTRCRGRVRTTLALPSSTDAGRLPPVVPYFNTQARPAGDRPMGWLRTVILPELPVGTEVRATFEGAGTRRRPTRASVGTDSGAVLLWRDPVPLLPATRLVLTAARPGTSTVRQIFRFVRRDGAIRARRLTSPDAQ